MPKDMNLDELQKQVHEILQQYEKPYWEPLSQLARLSEEVGEVARILNHKYGDKPKKLDEKPQDLADELADVLYTVICLANNEGIKLDRPLQRSIAKLQTRDKDRFKKKAA
jgi:NTP pyrophosphatase (non-canonical NTP hydrolase)